MAKKPKIGKYIAILTQEGEDTPIANVLHNTIGAIVWERFSYGNYGATMPIQTGKIIINGAGDVNNGIMIPTNVNTTAYISAYPNDNSSIRLRLWTDLNYTDNIDISTMGGSVYIEIDVYNN